MYPSVPQPAPVVQYHRGADAAATTIAAAAAAAAAVARATAAGEHVASQTSDATSDVAGVADRAVGVAQRTDVVREDQTVPESSYPCDGREELRICGNGAAIDSSELHNMEEAQREPELAAPAQQEDQEAVEQAQPQSHQHRQQQQPHQGQNLKRRLCRVSFSFTGMEEDSSQLSLAAGDLVRIQCRDPSGWTYGRLECVGGPQAATRASCVGSAGWFPDAVLGYDPSELAEDVEAEQVECSARSAATCSTRSRSQKGSHSARSALTDRYDGDVQDAERFLDRESANGRSVSNDGQHRHGQQHRIGDEVSRAGGDCELQCERRPLANHDKRMTDSARWRQRFMGVKDGAEKGILEAEMLLESAERQYRALEEQERRCRAEASCIAACSSSSLRRTWEAKLRMLEGKKEVAAQNLRAAQDRVYAEKEMAANARRRMRMEQQNVLAAMDAAARQRGYARASQTGAQSSSQLSSRIGTLASSRSASQTSLARASSVSSIASGTSAVAPSGTASKTPAERQPTPTKGGSLLGSGEPARRTVTPRQTPSASLRASSASRTQLGGGGSSGASPSTSRSTSSHTSTGNVASARLLGTSRSSAQAGGAPPPRTARHAFAFGASGNGVRERNSPVRTRPGSRVSSQERGEHQPSLQSAAARSARESAGRSDTASHASRSPDRVASAMLPRPPRRDARASSRPSSCVSDASDGRELSKEELSSCAADLLQTAEELQAKLESMPAPLLRRLAEQSAGAGSSAHTPVPAEWCSFRERLRCLLEDQGDEVVAWREPQKEAYAE